MGKGSGISNFDVDQLQNILANPIVEGATRNSLNAAERLLGLPSSAAYEDQYRAEQDAAAASGDYYPELNRAINDGRVPTGTESVIDAFTPDRYKRSAGGPNPPDIATQTSALTGANNPAGSPDGGKSGAMAKPPSGAAPPNADQRGLSGVPGTPEFYGGSTVAEMDPRRGAALQGLFERGMGGSPEELQLSNFLTSELGGGGGAGGLLSGLGVGQDALGQAASGQINPLVDDAFQSAASNLTESFNEGILPGINATFASAGRSGSGLQADALGNAAGELSDTLGSMAADMYGGAAESALNRQLTAGGLLQQGGLGGLGHQLGVAGLIPESAALDYAGLDAALGAGQGFEDYTQRLIDAGRERYEYNASRPLQDYQRNLDALNQYIGLTGPLQGTGTTTSSQNGGSTRLGK